MKLYNSNLSPFCARVRYLVRAKAIPVEIEDIDLASYPNYEKLNPLKRVPAFQTLCERYIFESDSICEYLEQLYPGPIFRSFLPEDAYYRARSRAATRINDIYIHPHYEKILWGTPKSEEEMEQSKAALDFHFNVIEGMLKESAQEGPFLSGKKPALGDISIGCDLLMATHFFPRVKFDLFQRRPHLKIWFETLLKDPDFVHVKNELDAALKERLEKIKKQKAKL